ncbi:MAG: hypothetical protein ACI4XC_01120 [Eubacterium sp.]
MNEFRKKQKKLFRIMKTLIVFSAVFIFVYIGAQPYVANFSQTLAIAINYVCDGLVIVNLVIIFFYYSKYGKSDSFLTSVEYEINDAGYYITSREESTEEDYLNTVIEDLKSNNFSIDKNITINTFTFDVRAYKKKEFFYIANIDALDKNDVIAYLDEVINDITVKNLKRKGNAVLCFITNKAQDDAVALSKMITPLGKKETIKISVAIVEPETKKVYFRGNEESVCRKLTANYVMNCDIPIKDKYIHREKLPFQHELEEKMKNFNIKDFKDGNFYIH